MASLPSSERQRALDQAVATYVAAGAHVEYQGYEQVVLVYGGKANHVLHAILSIVTFGLWLIVWLLVAINSRPRRVTLSVDRQGQVITDRPVFMRR